MATANVYLNFNGNCEEAFNFYRSVFGGEFTFFGRFNEMPAEAGNSMATEGEKVMHVSLPLGGGSMLMGSDTGGEWAAYFKQGNNFSVSLNTESREENERLYKALSEGGKQTVPLADTFWGDYFGMCEDRFGINWMFSFNDKNKG